MLTVHYDMDNNYRFQHFLQPAHLFGCISVEIYMFFQHFSAHNLLASLPLAGSTSCSFTMMVSRRESFIYTAFFFLILRFYLVYSECSTSIASEIVCMRCGQWNGNVDICPVYRMAAILIALSFDRLERFPSR